MRQRYNEGVVDLKGNVKRLLSQELCTDEYDERDILEHSIPEYGPEIVEWLNDHEEKTKHAWEQWWEEEGRDVASEYPNTHPQRANTIIGETQVVAFHEDVYAVLEEQIDSLEYGFGRNDHSRFLTALLIRHRDEIAEDVESEEEADEGEDAPQPQSADDLQGMSYRELQLLAKQHDVKANISQEELIDELEDELGGWAEE